MALTDEAKEIVPLNKTVKDLTPVNPIARKKDTVDYELIQEIRAMDVGLLGGEMTDDKASIIYNALENGVSFETASMYAGMTPGAFKKYIQEGFEEATRYTKEDFENGVEISNKAKFAVQCMQRKAKATAELTMDFYAKCQETGNTHLTMWLLERLDPTFHLKKKIEQEEDINVNSQQVVQFVFATPENMRSPEETELFREKLDALKKQYGVN